ncbi:MAG: hypothetical protein ABFS30_07010 [Pseudomonadota bacterium]
MVLFFLGPKPHPVPAQRRRFPATTVKDTIMSFRMALAMVFGIVISVAWISSMSSAADDWPTDITVVSQIANR